MSRALRATIRYASFLESCADVFTHNLLLIRFIFGIRLRFKIERRAVDAIPQASCSGAVVEDVAKMSAALVADDFVANHAVSTIDVGVDHLFAGGFVEAGPAAAAVK